MNVLSLFDGMSGAQIALNRAGIKYDKYFASEVDKYAIKITQKNYPDTEQRTDTQKNNSLCIRVGSTNDKGHDYNRRVYSTEGKSPTLSICSGGSQKPKILQQPHGDNIGGVKADNGKVPAMTASSWETNNHLIDGAHTRMLTPLECECLQTVPEGYTEGVSHMQRYKLLGNGFTIDVIAHILSYMEA